MICQSQSLNATPHTLNPIPKPNPLNRAVKSELKAAAYPLGTPPLGLQGGTVRGGREKVGVTLVYFQRFNGSSSRQLGSPSSSLLVSLSCCRSVSLS